MSGNLDSLAKLAAQGAASLLNDSELRVPAPLIERLAALRILAEGIKSGAYTVVNNAAPQNSD